jgi:hypothetical protein
MDEFGLPQKKGAPWRVVGRPCVRPAIRKPGQLQPDGPAQRVPVRPGRATVRVAHSNGQPITIQSVEDAADGGSVARPRRWSAKWLILCGRSASDPDVRGAVSAPCRRAASRGVPGGWARRVLASACLPRLLEPGLHADSRPAGEGGTRIAGRGTERREHERLQIFGSIPDATTHLDEPWAGAAVAPPLQRFHRHAQQGGRVLFGEERCHWGRRRTMAEARLECSCLVIRRRLHRPLFQA